METNKMHRDYSLQILSDYTNWVCCANDLWFWFAFENTFVCVGGNNWDEEMLQKYLDTNKKLRRGSEIE